ncbi:MAG: protein kinase [Cyanobacteria bacterium P01_A01_bin.84]
MQPPIQVGIVLQNRYRVLRTLGQGGFGRTYLAEDQRRFNELCAIKELIPMATDVDTWEKAQELFGREAATLYRIKHPQIPQFREQFEQDKRLFLVQDYISGRTYRSLLDDCQDIGSAFTQEEVLHLMRSLLPVLEYLHHLGIIHRDISPDNIILRDSDAKPVLIDFGVVKELATQLRTPHNQPNYVTTVGKLGYSPREQMQTGIVYPNSDLYALAVTAIVLLTGKEPNELFDETQATWNWYKFVRVDPRLVQIINRMLSYRPSDRYQSAAEVVNALRVLGSNSNRTVSSPVSPNPSPQTPDLSRMQTLAVGGSPPPAPPARPGEKNITEPKPVVSKEERNSSSILDSPLAIVGIGILVIVLAGFGSWAIVRSLNKNTFMNPQIPPEPQTFPSPVISGTETPTPGVEEPVIYSRRLRFDFSNTARVEGSVKATEIIQYTFLGKEDQQLSVLLNDDTGVVVKVLGPNRKPIDDANNVNFYQVKLPETVKYTIQVKTTPKFEEAEYRLKINLEDSIAPVPEATTPTIPTQRPPRNTPEIPTFPPTQEQEPTPETTPEPIFPIDIPSIPENTQPDNTQPSIDIQPDNTQPNNTQPDNTTEPQPETPTDNSSVPPILENQLEENIQPIEEEKAESTDQEIES